MPSGLVTNPSHIPNWIYSHLDSLETVQLDSLRSAFHLPQWNNSIVGSSYLTKRKGRYKTVKGLFPNQQWVCDIPGISGGCAARWGLQVAFDRIGAKHYSPKRWLNSDWRPLLSPPFYVLEGVYPGRGIYLDIKGCFWNLYRKMPLLLGLNSDYSLRWSIKPTHGELLPNDFGDYKLVRNSLPGNWRAGRTLWLKNGKIVEQELNWTPTRSLDHWLVLREILHWIAHHAVHEFKACYWHTDGGIWLEPWYEQAWAFVDWLYRTTGLVALQKNEGFCTISSLGNYKFEPFPTPAPSLGRGVNNIAVPTKIPTWLQFL